MKKSVLLIFFAFVLSAPDAFSQTVFGAGVNALGYAVMSPNIGIEAGLDHFSISVDAGFNPFTLKENRPTRFWAIQPEFKYWFNSALSGHAVGLHGLYGDYDFGLKRYRYDGSMYGGGISYTYAWRFRPRWCLEGSIGFGYTRLDNENVYERDDKYTCYGPSAKGCWNVSKAGIKITWIIVDKPKRQKTVTERIRPTKQVAGSGYGEAMKVINKLNNLNQ